MKKLIVQDTLVSLTRVNEDDCISLTDIARAPGAAFNGVEFNAFRPECASSNFEESRIVAQQGGTIAGNTRKEIEEKTGKKIVTGQSAKKLK